MPEVLSTIEALLGAIKYAKVVYIQPRFGTSEAWIRISKAEARFLAKALPENATPGVCEFTANQFGHMIEDELYLG